MLLDNILLLTTSGLFVLFQLKASAFEDFVRQIEFELGECLTTAIDLKERKIVAKQKETRGAYKPTPAEIQQYREYVASLVHVQTCWPPLRAELECLLCLLRVWDHVVFMLCPT